MMDMTIERLIEILEKAASINADTISEFNVKGQDDDWCARDIELAGEIAAHAQDTILTILSGIKNNHPVSKIVRDLTVELEYPT